MTIVTIPVVLGRFTPLIERGLANTLALEANVRVLARDLSHAELEKVVEEREPQVAILNETTESSVVIRIKEIRSTTGVLVLAHNPSQRYGLHLLNSGASCLPLEASVEDIVAAIRLTALSQRAFVSADGNRLERQYPVGALPLTPRELEVLAHLSAGRSDRSIASALQISNQTVHTHVAHIRRKLGVKSRRELIGMPIPRHSSQGTALASPV